MNYEQATQILKGTMDTLHTMAEALMKYETIDQEQIKDIMEGREPRPPKDWSDIPPAQPETGDAGADKQKDSGIGKPAEQH